MRAFCICFLVFFSLFSYSQNGLFKDKKKIKIARSGTFFGVQTGRYWVGEIGVERQRKQLKIKKPNTHAFYFSLNYDLDNSVLGSEIGYWFKTSNLGFSYGIRGIIKSDFSSVKYGLAPSIGYKIMQLHVSAGYQFLVPSRRIDSFEVNYLFLSVRFLLVNDIDVKRKKKRQ
jgi:hypothetical protein